MSGEQLQLWEPQQQALAALQRAYSQEVTPEQPQIIQMPTGCGKSVVAAMLPRYLPSMPRCTVLVVVPNVALVTQMKKAICALYTRFRIDGVRVFATELTSRQQIFQLADRLARREERSPSYNFLVCNIHKLCQFSKRWQNVAKVIDVVVIDEAHHMLARSWQEFLYDRRCLGGKVKRQVLFTATPFRTDQQPLSGQLCFAYPYRRAIELGLIRHPVIHSRHGGSADQDQRDIDLLRRTEALLKQQGGDRQAIGCAASVADAERIAALARQHTRLSVDVWHSRMGKHEQARVRKNFERPESPEQRTDMLLQVNMCSEGYDHPPVSVVTFFRAVRSPLSFIQAVGRASRRSLDDRQRNAHSRSFIVSDDRLNARVLWQHFKQHVDDYTIEPLLESEDADATSPEDVGIHADGDSVDVEDVTTKRTSTDERSEQRSSPASSSSSSLPVGWWTDPFDATLFSSGTATSKPRRDEDDDLRQKRDLPGPRPIEFNDGRKRARTSDTVSLADRAITVIEEKQRALEQAKRDLDLLRTAEQQLGRSLALL